MGLQVYMYVEKSDSRRYSIGYSTIQDRLKVDFLKVKFKKKSNSKFRVLS